MPEAASRGHCRFSAGPMRRMNSCRRSNPPRRNPFQTLSADYGLVSNYRLELSICSLRVHPCVIRIYLIYVFMCHKFVLRKDGRGYVFLVQDFQSELDELGSVVFREVGN